MMNLAAVPWVWDNYLTPGTVKQGVDGVWHIGRGTDLKELAEKLNTLSREQQPQKPPIDFNVLASCSACSEKYGICGHHQNLYGVNYKGEPCSSI